MLPFAAEAGIIKKGSFIKSTSNGAQVVSHGLGETPKAIIFWTTGRNNESFGDDFHYSFGVTDGTTSRCSSAASQDNELRTNASRRIAIAAITIAEWDEQLIAEALFVSWNTTTFTLTWTTNNNQPYIIHFVAIGGPEVSAKVVGWNMPTDPGNFSVTAVGFQPSVVIHSHVGSGYISGPGTVSANAVIGTAVMDSQGAVWSSEIPVLDNGRELGFGAIKVQLLVSLP